MKKVPFLKIFLFCFQLIIKAILLLGCLNPVLCCRLAKSYFFLTGLLQYLSKNMAILPQKLCGEKKMKNAVSGYLKALMAWSLVEELFYFLLLPLRIIYIINNYYDMHKVISW